MNSRGRWINKKGGGGRVPHLVTLGKKLEVKQPFMMEGEESNLCQS